MRLLLIALAAAIMLFGPASAVADPPLTFTSQQAAQSHCPADTVVWLNLPTGGYHFQGRRWYRSTKYGAYV